MRGYLLYTYIRSNRLSVLLIPYTKTLQIIDFIGG